MDGHKNATSVSEIPAKIAPCSPESDSRLFWHLGNVDKETSDHRCCSGLRAWNTDQCLSDLKGISFGTFVCEVSGSDHRQAWRITGDKAHLRRKDMCISVIGESLVSNPCTPAGGEAAIWSRWMRRQPLETRIYLEAQKANPEVFALLEARKM